MMMTSTTTTATPYDNDADDATNEQQQRQYDIDRLVVNRLQQGHVGGHKHDLEQRGADHHRSRHAEQVDHRRYHHEAAADTHDRR